MTGDPPAPSMTTGFSVPPAELGAQLRAARDLAVVHLDAAGAGVPSRAVVDAQVTHLRREAEIGSYPAQTEALPQLDAARDALAALVGFGRGTAALVENATRGFVRLIEAWPLTPGAVVGVVPGEYVSNRMVLEARQSRGEIRLRELAVDALGRIDVDRLDEAIADGVELLVFDVIASQFGVVQPAAEVAGRARPSGVRLLLDAAQAAGQIDLTEIYADAFVGTARKWLCGPRGVGWVAVNTDVLDELELPHPDAGTHEWGDPPVPLPGATRVELYEAPVSARVGFGVALAELSSYGVPPLHQRIVELGRQARERLDGVAGWRVREPLDEPTGMVTLSHERLVPAETAARLREQGILVAAIPADRGPREGHPPLLRASCHAYADARDVEALAVALEKIR
jgi:pyridoxal 5-phosphate dependent beta-lyase